MARRRDGELADISSKLDAYLTRNEHRIPADQVADDTLQLMRQDIRSERKKIVAANLPLTEAEAVKFWPVYDRYALDRSKIYDTRFAAIKEYAQSYNTLTDEQALSLIKGWIATEEDMAQLRLKWMPEFQKVIPPKKTAMFYQIDRRLGYMVELQLTSQIPLVKP